MLLIRKEEASCTVWHARHLAGPDLFGILAQPMLVDWIDFSYLTATTRTTFHPHTPTAARHVLDCMLNFPGIQSRAAIAILYVTQM